MSFIVWTVFLFFLLYAGQTDKDKDKDTVKDQHDKPPQHCHQHRRQWRAFPWPLLSSPRCSRAMRAGRSPSIA